MTGLASVWHEHPDLGSNGTPTPLESGIRAAGTVLTPGRATVGQAVTVSFREYVSRVRPRYIWYRHCELIAGVLQRVADDELKRVMFFLPPRHSKTETISRLFMAYYLARHPDRWGGLASYAAELAHSISRDARELFVHGGGTIADDAGTIRRWRSIGPGGEAAGGMWAAGVGGAMTGQGFHLGLIDDPVKNAEEAASAIIGRRNQNWYRSTFYTRAEPGAALVVVQTRWPGPGDLAGWLLEQEKVDDEQPERWHVVSLEAVKEKEPMQVPVSCTLEPDTRKEGEALCPERYPLERLVRIRARLTAFFWLALFQQRPVPREGGMLKRVWFPIVPAMPHDVTAEIRFWDQAATPGGGDWTSGCRMARTAKGLFIIRDMVRGQWSSGERDKRIRQTAMLDGAEVPIAGEQEPGASGKDAAAAFIKLLTGFAVSVRPSTGDKTVRAGPLASAAEVGNVAMLVGDWNEPVLNQLAEFPYGKHDDDVDSIAGAFNKCSLTSDMEIW